MIRNESLRLEVRHERRRHVHSRSREQLTNGEDLNSRVLAARHLVTERAREPSDSRDSIGPLSFAGGRYQVRSLLGEGGQKRAFLARDTQLDRDVVIGVLNGPRIESDSLDRLRREAGENVESQIERAFQLAYSRNPDAEELATIKPFVEQHGLPELCRVLLNSNEFLYVE